MLILAGCQTKPPPAPPAPVVEAPAPPPKPTSIVMEDSDLAGFQGALRELGGKPVDVPVGWANPLTGKRGSVKVLRDGYDGQNRPCREFHSVVILEEMYQHATGFFCRQPDGVWEVVQARDYPLYRHGS
ncbi:RT0821/Lpp0805 family surface protein [Niveispirillum fermenti]|uniref:RT0821/Lpp0805 family surface protein n=1 Tax=Niveispirillum fermenti TaxID=1233113 RepID=UPI003A899F1D